MFGVEELYDGLLLEAKTPEEIKNILQYQFVQGQKVPQEILDAVFDMDPTKKKSYTRWLLSQWKDHSKEISKAISNGKLKTLFDYFKKRAETKDSGGIELNQSIDFPTAMSMLPNVDPILSKTGDADSPENDFEIVYDTDEWTIAVPHSYAASLKLGKGCRWCTAGAFSNGENYFENYSRKGPLWINFDKSEPEIAPMDKKEYPYTRYQFLFEWNNWAGEFMDSSDSRVEPNEMELPDGVKEFYAEQNEKYGEIIENGADDTEKRQDEYWNERTEMAYAVFLDDDGGEEIYLLPELDDDDYDIDALHNNTNKWCLYSEYDLADPITPENGYAPYFNPEDFMVRPFNSGGDFKGAILKESEYGEYVFLYYSRDNNRWEIMDEISCNLGSNITTISDGDSPLIIVEDGDSGIIELSNILYDSYFGSSCFENPQIGKFMKESGEEPDGYYIEVILADKKSHSLIKLDQWDVENSVTIISNDVPENGKYFEATFKNNHICIKGNKFTYNIDDTSENMNIVKDLDGGHNFIVKIGEDKYNVWRKDTDKLCLDKNVEYVSQINEQLIPNFVLAKYGDGRERIYDIKGHQFWFGDIFSVGFMSTQYPVYKVKTINEETIVVNFGRYPEKVVFKCEQAVPVDYYTYNPRCPIMVKLENGEMNILNGATCKLILPLGVERAQPMRESDTILAKFKDGSIKLFDYDGNLISGSADGGEVSILSRSSIGNVLCVKNKRGKFELFLNGKRLTEYSFDKCYEGLKSQGAQRIGIPVLSNGSYFIIVCDKDDYRIFPSINGIPKSEFEIMSDRGQVEGWLSFKIKSIPGGVFYYNPFTNKMSTNGRCSEEDSKKIEKMITNNAEAIRENFQKIYKSITKQIPYDDGKNN